MALHRQPEIGEILKDGSGRTWEVTGFPKFYPSICTIIKPGCQAPKNPLDSSFIWQFGDGSFNTYFSHTE